MVVGDHCTDDSEDVVASFGDERLRWHNLPVNSGSQSLPNNAALSLARGELVAYLGHDDVWLPTHLARLVSRLAQGDAAGAYTACAAIGPPGSNILRLSGLGRWNAELRVLPSSLAHRRDVIDEVGEWRDYRTLTVSPDREFITRLAQSDAGLVPIAALTVCKLSSGWRPNCYVLRRSDEQAAIYRRTMREPRFVAEQVARFVWLWAIRARVSVPEDEPKPEVVPPGWYVTQSRKIRGLPEHPEG